MILGRIAAQGSGTRISGRAGLDLNGAIAALLVSIAAITVTWGFESSGQTSLNGALIFGGILAALVGLGFWTRSFFHRDAEPLVRFLRNTVTPRG